MSRIRPGAYRRLGGPRFSGGRRRPLVSLYDGTFTRSSEISVRRTDGSIDWIPSGERAIVDLAAYVPGASGQRLLYTEAHTQELTDADDLTGAAWSTIAASVSVSAETGKDGSAAYDVDLDANASARLVQTVPHENLPDDVTHSLSVWAKVASGTEKFRMQAKDKSGASVLTTSDFDATTTWQRFDASFDVGSDASPVDVEVRIINGSDATSKTIIAWLPNLTEGFYPVPSIRGSTPQTLAASQWSVANVPQQILSGRCRVGLVPFFDSSGVLPFFSAEPMDFDNDNRMQANSKPDDWFIKAGGTNVVAITPVTFSRLSQLQFDLDAAAGEVTVSGFDSGNAKYTGTAWDWSGVGDLYIGGKTVSDFDGLIAPIERW